MELCFSFLTDGDGDGDEAAHLPAESTGHTIRAYWFHKDVTINSTSKDFIFPGFFRDFHFFQYFQALRVSIITTNLGMGKFLSQNYVPNMLHSTYATYRS